MRHSIPLAALAALVLATPAAAQSAMKTRDDSLAVPRKYMTWVHEYAADSLWAHFGPQLRQVLESEDGLRQQLDQLTLQLGAETGVVEETISVRNGNLVYLREVTFENMQGDTGMWMLEIAPDGTIVNGGMQPKSRMRPPANDPAGSPD